MPVCRSCRRPIKFVLTKKGRQMPVDVEPRPDGNVVLRVMAGMGGELSGTEPVVHILEAGEEPREGETRWQSHFASCPNAATHRRRR